jgi:hypothetical protein
MLANYIKSNDIYEEEAKPSTKDLKNKTVGRVFILLTLDILIFDTLLLVYYFWLIFIYQYSVYILVLLVYYFCTQCIYSIIKCRKLLVFSVLYFYR